MKYSGLLLCSDFDGTLVGSDKKVSAENKEAIRMFTENGGKFTLASGRSAQFIHENLADIPINAPLITLNGAAVYDTALNKYIRSTPIESIDKRLVFDLFSIESCEHIYYFDTDGNFDYIYKDGPDPLGRLANILNDNKLYKLVFVFKDEDTPSRLSPAMSEKYRGKYFFAKSWNISLEMLNYNSTKGICAEFIKEYLGDVDTVVGVGDYENDIPLIASSDIGYAVENAIQKVKNCADRITVSCDNSAIAHIIYEL